MKTFTHILALLMALLMLCGMTGAFAEAELTLDTQPDIVVPELDMDVPAPDSFPEAIGLADDPSLAEEAPEAANPVGNAVEEYYESFTLTVGDQKKLHNHVRTYSTLIITDTSSDPNVARISASGTVTAVTAGKCVITVTAEPRWDKDRPTRVWRYDVTVVGGPVLSETEKTLYVDETFQLTVSNLGKRSVKSWSSSDTSVAKVDNGKVTAVGVGTCVISAEISNGGFLRCKVEVKDSEGLTSNYIQLELHKQTIVRLKHRYLRNVTWSCSNSRIVKIVAKGSKCRIIARKRGKCTVTVRLKSGEKYSCRVVVV